jgi:putative flippase GtrA
MDTLLRLLRYGAVGMAMNVAGYLVYLAITRAGAEPKATMSFLYFVGATLGYFGHRRLAFGFHGSYLSSAARYVLAHFAGYGLNLALLLVFVDRLEYPHQIVQGTAIFVVAAFLFVCFNYIVFPSARAGTERTMP